MRDIDSQEVSKFINKGTYRYLLRGYPGGSVVENPPVMQEMQVDPWVRKTPSLEEGTENPLQYSCLENPMDRGYTVHGVVSHT